MKSLPFTKLCKKEISTTSHNDISTSSDDIEIFGEIKMELNSYSIFQQDILKQRDIQLVYDRRENKSEKTENVCNSNAMTEQSEESPTMEEDFDQLLTEIGEQRKRTISEQIQPNLELLNFKCLTSEKTSRVSDILTRTVNFNQQDDKSFSYIPRKKFAEEITNNKHFEKMMALGDELFNPDFEQQMRNQIFKKTNEEKKSFQSFELNLDDVLNGKDKRTALMVKNIPNKYTQKMIIQKIHENFRGKYDFFYLPIDFKNKCNVGYAFINFVDPLFILKFFEEFYGKKWQRFNSEKICKLTYGRIQGKQNLMDHFSTSSVMTHHDKKVKPLMLNVSQPNQNFVGGYMKNFDSKLVFKQK